MRTRRLGRSGPTVSALGYGAMALSLEGRPTEGESLGVLRGVLDAGVTLIDTSDTYGLGPEDLHHNERLIARVLRETHRSACVATKGGCVRTVKGWEIDGSPDRLYRVIVGSYEALGGATPIPLWQHHWPDARHSISAMMKAARRAVDEKLVLHVGVGNYNIAQIREARDVVEVVSVQNQFNLWHREAERDGILEYCEQEGLAFLPWRPLGGLGLAERLMEIAPVAEISRARGISPQRLMIAWLLAKSSSILPIPGSRKISNILDALAADEVRLDAREMARLDAIRESDLPRRARPPAWEQSPGLAS